MKVPSTEVQNNFGKYGEYQGVPTLAVEVLYRSTRRKDMLKKLDLYMQTGVKEYWMVELDKKEHSCNDV